MYFIEPDQPLDRFVEVIWMLPEEQEGSSSYELALPTGTVEIVMNLDEQISHSFDLNALENHQSLSGPLICGAHDRPFLIDQTNSGRVIGINFKPGGIAGLLPTPVDVTRNLQFGLDELAPTLANQLSELIGSTNQDPLQLLETVSRILTTALCRDRHPVVEWAVDELKGSPVCSIADLVMRSGYSHRRFNQIFRSEVGLTAKQFAKVMRFQHTLNNLKEVQNPDWVGLAMDCGYTDQAHLIHEFNYHGSMTPSQFLDSRTDRLNHPTFEP